MCKCVELLPKVTVFQISTINYSCETALLAITEKKQKVETSTVTQTGQVSTFRFSQHATDQTTIAYLSCCQCGLPATVHSYVVYLERWILKLRDITIGWKALIGRSTQSTRSYRVVCPVTAHGQIDHDVEIFIVRL